MKTVTEKYHAVNEGTLSKAEFVRQMRLTHPQIISQFNGFDDSVQILKNRGLLFEKKEEVEYENPSYNLSPDAVRRGLRYELLLAGLDPAGDISEEDYMKAHKKAEDNIMKDQLHYYRMIADDKTKVEHDKMKETKRGTEETDTDNAMAKVKLNENTNKKQLIRESVKSCSDIIKAKYPNASADDILDFFDSLDQEQLNQMYNDDPAFDCEQEYEEFLIANKDSLDEKESTVVDKKAMLENAVHTIKQVFPELTREIFKAYIDTHYTDLLNDPKIDVAKDFVEWAYVNGYMDDKPGSLDETESSINERVGSLQEFIALIEDRAAESGFSEAEEAEEVIEALKDHYSLNEKKGKDHDRDGDIDSDDYIAAKDKAIKKAMGKNVNEAEEKIKRALKKKIVQILKEGHKETLHMDIPQIEEPEHTNSSNLSSMVEDNQYSTEERKTLLKLDNLVNTVTGDTLSYQEQLRSTLSEFPADSQILDDALEAFKSDVNARFESAFSNMDSSKEEVKSEKEVEAMQQEQERLQQEMEKESKKTVFNENKKTK